MRRLAAIILTDMVGFTALMQEDEHRAKSIRDRHRDALRESIEQHGGEIVQFYGDGTLRIFVRHHKSWNLVNLAGISDFLAEIGL